MAFLEIENLEVYYGLIRAVKGDVENGLIFSGAESYRTKKLETVQEVVDSLL